MEYVLFMYQTTSLLTLVLLNSESTISVCLKGTVENGFLRLDCKVDDLRANVEIYGPDSFLYGSCLGPTEFSPRYEVCDKERNITQNLDTNVITIVLAEGDNYEIYGPWVCKHGTGLGSDTFTVKRAVVESKQPCADTTVLVVMISLCCILFGVVVYLLYEKKFKDRNRDRAHRDDGDGDEERNINASTPLLGLEATDNECRKCKMLSACAICATCEDFYCESCCDAHTKNSPEHNVCLIEHVMKGRFDVKCKKCKKKEPTLVCTKCKKLYCNDCTCEHASNSVKINLVTSKGKPCVRIFSKCSSALKYKCIIDLFSDDPKSNRVCGLCLLNDETVVLADINNKKLKAFTTCNQKNYILTRQIDLSDEPRGMTHMFDYKVAVTFAYKQEIHIFDIADPGKNPNKIIPLAKIGKPYSIAYNADHFAVEIDESEDGFIGILDTNGTLMHKIKNKNDDVAYFTGNSIRLALDMTKGTLFVAAMSKKTVACIDFLGKTKWKVSIPSPRGILFVPGIPLENKNLILASKRHDTVYEMSSKDGNTEVLMSGNITGPRYMAYNLLKKLLCVQVDDNKLMVFKYEIK